MTLIDSKVSWLVESATTLFLVMVENFWGAASLGIKPLDFHPIPIGRGVPVYFSSLFFLKRKLILRAYLIKGIVRIKILIEKLRT